MFFVEQTKIERNVYYGETTNWRDRFSGHGEKLGA
ncbi:Predicted protein [Anoxybacillus flavithermus WK1]|uniref:GIY-YIG domain-containing protein n=1 Tax=Anoxybacillus flavithermus (strain DSM 21510 / WK1) TaxID=491915 RepID=B7GHJ0_ANOFW|nr:Predicted protein [Anoxybacillus flavithermus WK1]